MASDGTAGTTDLTDREREAVHEIELELGIEWLRRAHGALVEFHHNTGHAMDHFAAAEPLLRETGHPALADALRDDCLPRGVLDDERWSYDVLEDFEEGFMTEMDAFEREVREAVSAGRRHVVERAQEREWKRRARGADETE